MNKNYSPKFSDAQLDRILQTAIKSVILTENEVSEIAESAALRRSMLNCISEEKTRRQNRWFFGRHWQPIAAGTFVFLIVAGAFVWFSTLSKLELAAVSSESNFISEQISHKNIIAEVEPANVQPPTAVLSSKTNVSKKQLKIAPVKQAENSLKSRDFRLTNAARPRAVTLPKTEISTEFIALTYSPSSESGQIVRVKVPRSMLISLGVSSNVGRTKEFVNAEVIVGDDGAAQAIRFLND